MINSLKSSLLLATFLSVVALPLSKATAMVTEDGVQAAKTALALVRTSGQDPRELPEWKTYKGLKSKLHNQQVQAALASDDEKTIQAYLLGCLPKLEGKLAKAVRNTAPKAPKVQGKVAALKAALEGSLEDKKAYLNTRLASTQVRIDAFLGK